MYVCTQARATETCGLILSAMSSSTVDEKAVLSQGVPSILQPHQVKACSMITEGAVHAPSPPYANWPVSERNFHLGNTRVTLYNILAVHLFCPHVLSIQSS